MNHFIYLIFFLLPLTTIAQNAQNRVIPADAKKNINPVATDNKTIAYGGRIYRKVCLTCHGDFGHGDGPQAHELANKPASFKEDIVMHRSDGELFWWISNGGSDMQPFKEVLSEDDIWTVVQYVRKLQQNP